MSPRSQHLSENLECNSITICRSYINALRASFHSIQNKVRINNQNHLLSGSKGSIAEREIAGFEGLDKTLLETDEYIKNHCKLLDCRRQDGACLQETSIKCKTEFLTKDVLDCLTYDLEVDYLAKNMGRINLESSTLPKDRTMPERSLVQTCLNLLERGVQLKKELQDHMKLSLFKLKNNYATVKNAANALREAHLMSALKVQWFEDMKKYSALCDEELKNAHQCLLLAQEFEKIVADLMKSDKREFLRENASCR